MSTAAHCDIAFHNGFDLSRHAWQRINGRGLSLDAIQRVIKFGRVAHVRGAKIFAVGRKESARFNLESIDLSDVEGVQVVCSDDGVIMTVYRNRDFRGLRPRRQRARQYS
ncbi:MAG: DUF4258 domain-containing protein [Planctomycetota bacterium]|jgi:hypothetical protein